ncbi:hypothetical protein, partial [Acinetobacter baumannii]|uniref:hypothetical protein n=1 Tax=Acinetobacter baumannii TaxID=470 RepID=UPI00197A8619
VFAVSLKALLAHTADGKLLPGQQAAKTSFLFQNPSLFSSLLMQGVLLRLCVCVCVLCVTSVSLFANGT